ncbi:MAG: hypothetical protein ACI8VI_000253, partial [Granulosicoccus sp.]
EPSKGRKLTNNAIVLNDIASTLNLKKKTF